MQKLIKRIFEGVTFPEGLSKPEFNRFIDTHVERFENGGFLEQTKLTPIEDEDQLVDVLAGHKPSDLVVVKFYKRGCLPCMSIAEAYKEAEKKFHEKQLPVSFYSVNIKQPSCAMLVRNQLVTGTPTVQTFVDGRQVGEEIRATNTDAIFEAIRMRLPAGSAMRIKHHDIS